MNKLTRFLFASAITVLFLPAAFGGGFHIIPNILYVPRGNESRTGDLYIPDGATGDVPVVIVIHGGGWVHGNNQGGATLAISQALASNGFAAFNINYRLVGKGGEYPANVQDVKDAAAYLTLNAGRYHIDPKRIAALGESSGGHLALLAAYSPNTPPLNAPHYPDQPFHISAAIGYYTPSDFRHGKDHNGVVAAYLQVKADNPDMKRVTEASPVTYIATAVPTLLLHGDWDMVVPFSQSETLVALLKARGIPATLKRFPFANHAFDKDAGRRQEALDTDVKFLKEQFEPKLPAAAGKS